MLKDYNKLIEEIDRKLEDNETKDYSNKLPPGTMYVEVGEISFGEFGVKQLFGICKAKDFQKRK